MTMTRADIEFLILSKPDGGQVNLHGQDLSHVDLSDLDLTDANLCQAICVETRFTNAKLKGANLSEGRFDGAVFNGADLDEVNAADACLCRTMAYNARTRRMNLCGACAEGSEGLDIQIRTIAPDELNKHLSKHDRVTYRDGVLVTYGKRLADSNITDFSVKHLMAEDRKKLMAGRGDRIKMAGAAAENLAARRAERQRQQSSSARQTSLGLHRKALADAESAVAGTPEEISGKNARIADLKERIKRLEEGSGR